MLDSWSGEVNAGTVGSQRIAVPAACQPSRQFDTGSFDGIGPYGRPP